MENLKMSIKNTTYRGIGETLEKAYNQAEKKIPKDAEIIDKKQIDLVKPGKSVITINAFDEDIPQQSFLDLVDAHFATFWFQDTEY